MQTSLSNLSKSSKTAKSVALLPTLSMSKNDIIAEKKRKVSSITKQSKYYILNLMTYLLVGGM